MHGCGSDGKILLSDLVVSGNINTATTASGSGAGAMWLHYIDSITTIRNVVFENNQDSRALDIYIDTFSDTSVRLINNVHVPPSIGSFFFGIPPVVKVLMSCDEVNHGYRGVVNAESMARLYWLKGPSLDLSVKTRCSFVPKGGLTQLSAVINDPLNFKVDGWNVIARRQWQDGIDFDREWNDYKSGFGNLNTGFWIGNDQVSKWTKERDYSLRVDLCTLNERYQSVKVPIAVETDFSKWRIEAGISRDVKSDGSVVITRDINDWRVGDGSSGAHIKSGFYCGTEWEALGGDNTARDAICAANGGNCMPKDNVDLCKAACQAGWYGVSYKSNKACLLATVSTTIDKCVKTHSEWTTYFYDDEYDFLTIVDLSKHINRCPGCRMLLTVEGEASKENEVKLKGISSWGGNSFHGQYLPTTSSSITKIEFQPPDMGHHGTLSELKLRINFYLNSWGESFTLRKVTLHAINECGEGLYDTFSIGREEENYLIHITPTSLNWKLSTQFLASSDYRTVSGTYLNSDQRFYLGDGYVPTFEKVVPVLEGVDDLSWVTLRAEDDEVIPFYLDGTAYGNEMRAGSVLKIDTKSTSTAHFYILQGQINKQLRMVEIKLRLATDKRVYVSAVAAGWDENNNGGDYSTDALILAAWNGRSSVSVNIDSTTSSGCCYGVKKLSIFLTPINSMQHSSILAGVYPDPNRQILPEYTKSVSVYDITGDYSSLQLLEMKIKPKTPFSSQGSGPTTVVATCADLTALLDDCARRCIERPMIHGGQHPMGVWCPTSFHNNNNFFSWWVSPTGDDDVGSGEEEYPLKTISTGLSRANSGDIVQLASGTHTTTSGSGGGSGNILDENSCHFVKSFPPLQAHSHTPAHASPVG